MTAKALLPAGLFALLLATSPGEAARTLLAELLARTPAAPGTAALSAEALRICMTRARDLDGMGVTLDGGTAAVERMAMEDRLLKNRIAQEIAGVNEYTYAELIEFQKRVVHQSEFSHKLEREVSALRERQASYETDVAAFERDCALPFTAADRAAASEQLGIK